MDIRNKIGHAPNTKRGWTPGSSTYLVPYNPLEKQLRMVDLSGISVDDLYSILHILIRTTVYLRIL